MNNLQAILDKYETQYSISANTPTELSIEPQSGKPGMKMVVYGSFDRDPLGRCTLTGFRMPGLAEDVSDDQIDEDVYFRIAEAVLQGEYDYQVQNRNLIDRIVGGTVYLSIGPVNSRLVTDFRCVNQSAIQKDFKSGLLKTMKYELA